MQEDLASMGGLISDEDFTSIILGSIAQSYDTYIAAITATSSLLNATLLPTNLIDAIRDEANQRTICYEQLLLFFSSSLTCGCLMIFILLIFT
jgi:hypothetical protein